MVGGGSADDMCIVNCCPSAGFGIDFNAAPAEVGSDSTHESNAAADVEYAGAGEPTEQPVARGGRGWPVSVRRQFVRAHHCIQALGTGS